MEIHKRSLTVDGISNGHSPMENDNPDIGEKTTNHVLTDKDDSSIEEDFSFSDCPSDSALARDSLSKENGRRVAISSSNSRHGSSCIGRELDESFGSCSDDISESLEGSSMYTNWTSSLSSHDMSDELDASISQRRTGMLIHGGALVDTPSIDMLAILSESQHDVGQKIELSKVLLERASTVNSIKWLGHHLPECVVAFLIDEIEIEEAKNEANGRNAEDADDFFDIESVNLVKEKMSSGKPDVETDVDDISIDLDDISLSNGLLERPDLNSGGEKIIEKKDCECDQEEDDKNNYGTEPLPQTTTQPLAPSGDKEQIRRDSSSSNGSQASLTLDDINNSKTDQQRVSFLPKDREDLVEDDIIKRFENIKLQQLRRSKAAQLQNSKMYQSCPSLLMPQRGSFRSALSDSRRSRRSIEKIIEGNRDTTATDSDNQNGILEKKQQQLQQASLQESFTKEHLIPPAMRHDCALLFVDISGFTKLSTALDVEALSKTINSYFQMIVDEVEAFGGDILKFAGDAVFAEWQSTASDAPDEATLDGLSISGSSCGSIKPWHGLEAEECVLTAAACGVKIVEKCADFAVYAGQDGVGPQVATLNVYCAVGFGEVVGVHIGDQETRMEYLILGDPIRQVTDAIEVAGKGEVFSSPEALEILEETADFSDCIVKNGVSSTLIATKEKSFFKPSRKVHVQQNWTTALQDFTTKPRERLAKRCDDWDLPALKRLRQRMSVYVHPVVVNDEFANKDFQGNRGRAQERHRSEAELRGVYTVFIMPCISAELTGDDEEDGKVLGLMNDIMLIVTKELERFKGQLRQFIVDDKGVVLIANFGLRGSTFPNMVSERAIPFTTAVQTLLKSELKVDCNVGATFGKAYCGVVGGVSRHEYAVLGPSVNLAARLMSNRDNPGFLVDEAVRQKAGDRVFRALPPVRAKGYTNLVPIFEPLLDRERHWKALRGNFVGREKELADLVNLSEDVIDYGGPSKLVLVTGAEGAGKSALCLQATRQIQQMCIHRSAPHIISRNVCNEGDSFVPFSIVRPIFLDVLQYTQGGDEKRSNVSVETDEIRAFLYDNVREKDAPQALAMLVHVCRELDIPIRYIEIICCLIFTTLVVEVTEGNKKRPLSSTEMKSVSSFLVQVFLHCTINFDLVLMALDDAIFMDKMSWRVVQLLYEHGRNTMTIITSRSIANPSELKMEKKFWDHLNNEGISEGRFSEISLSPMDESDVELLVAKSLGRKGSEIDPKISRDVFVQSGGMPHLASEILDKINQEDLLGSPENGLFDLLQMDESSRVPVSDETLDVGNVGELVLHRMDSLPSTVRTHLNLGALLGSCFELMDVVIVFEQYREVTDDELLTHAKSVHESLETAVNEGILVEVKKEAETIGDSGIFLHGIYRSSDHPYLSNNKTYKFAHEVWRNNILRLTLDEWKRDMHGLIAQSMEPVLETTLASDDRILSKLFGHWKESGSASKASCLALKMGRTLEDRGLTHQSLLIYRESLYMWRAADKNATQDESVGGLCIKMLKTMEASDLELLINLNVSVGRCFAAILEPKECKKAYQTALNIIHKAPASVDLEDRTIIFPVLCGLFTALNFGPNEDFAYEQGLVRMFLRETKLHGDPVHLARAWAMQGEMMGRHGKFDLALIAQSQLFSIYDVNDHSALICRYYGSDRSAQCISQSALWHLREDNIEEALETCKLVVCDLLPDMEQQNVHNCFLTLYPIVWVMKDHGMSLQAKEAFDEFVVKNFENRMNEKGQTPDRPLHKPIQMLLELSGAVDCSSEIIDDYIQWTLDEKCGIFATELNYLTGNLGRTANSITAEICLLLSKKTRRSETRMMLIRKGFELAQYSMDLTSAKDDSRGMINAYLQIKCIHDELETLHASLPPERRSRRISCGF